MNAFSVTRFFQASIPEAAATKTFGTASSASRPHKCHCCDGWGTRESKDVEFCKPKLEGVEPRRETCRACNGSGLVWR